MKTYSVIVIGAGCRGGMYADLMAGHPDKYRVIGVAEPIEGRREALRTRLNLDPDLCFLIIDGKGLLAGAALCLGGAALILSGAQSGG